jgi:hypothetical protein
MRISEIQIPYIREKQIYDESLGNIEKRIQLRIKQEERLRAKLNKLHRPNWVDSLVKPIAEELVKAYPDRCYEILGPFGIGAYVGIHFYKKDVDEKRRFDDDNCISITIAPGDLDNGELMIVDYSSDTKQYAQGTLGYLNDCNYPKVPINPDSDVSELLEWLEKARVKKAGQQEEGQF